MVQPANNQKNAWVYPFHFELARDFADYRRDESGVPLVFYRHLRRWVYNPITISQFGLAQLARFVECQQEQGAQLGRSMADWLSENLENWQHGIGAWVYRFDLPFYGPRAPWISAMAQGQGISLLLRVQRLFPESAYEEACHRAVQAFYHVVDEGGVARTFPDGGRAFEEYTTAEPSLVLNGMLFALLGLHDYAGYFEDTHAQESFAAGLAGVKSNLWRYDTGFWNHYDLHRSRRLTSPAYIRIHVQLLRILTRLAGDEYFASVAQRWEGYLKDRLCRLRYVAYKSVEKIRLRLHHYPAALT